MDNVSAEFKAFIEKMNACIEGTMAFTLIISDPADNR
jgi:C4-type Zn-finger protein